jgi:hypothetical protein
MADPFKFHRIKAALIAAGLHADALAMDAVLNLGCSFEHAWEFVGAWRAIVRDRPYRDALMKMKIGDNDSASAANLIHELRRYAARQYEIDRRSAIAPLGKNAALFIILNASGGTILTHGAFRRKFAKLARVDF